MKLTDHFTLEEMIRSATATRLGLDNTPPPDLQGNVLLVAQTLEIIRGRFMKQVHVTSCFRCEAVNKAVGGSPTSAHRYGMAADFEVAGVSNIEVCRLLPSIIPDFDQIIYEFGPQGWVHLGLTHGTPRRQMLTALKDGGRTVYKPGIQDLWK